MNLLSFNDLYDYMTGNPDIEIYYYYKEFLEEDLIYKGDLMHSLEKLRLDNFRVDHIHIKRNGIYYNNITKTYEIHVYSFNIPGVNDYEV